MSEAGCVATVELTVRGVATKLPCPNQGVICDVAGESFSVKAVLCASHRQIAESEGLRVTPIIECGNPVQTVQGSD